MRKLVEKIDFAALSPSEAARLYRFFDAAESVAVAGMTLVLPVVDRSGPSTEVAAGGGSRCQNRRWSAVQRRAVPGGPRLRSTSASRVPAAVASHVSRAAWSRAASPRRVRRRSSLSTDSRAAPNWCRRVDQEAGDPVLDGVAVTGDPGDHGRRPAGGRFGDGHAPALALRGADQDPGPAVGVEEFVLRLPARPVRSSRSAPAALIRASSCGRS